MIISLVLRKMRFPCAVCVMHMTSMIYVLHVVYTASATSMAGSTTDLELTLDILSLDVATLDIAR